jgi:L-fuconolactonase
VPDEPPPSTGTAAVSLNAMIQRTTVNTPTARIIDSHVHFWDRERFTTLWLQDADAALQPSHLPSDLAATGWSADAIVAVQADCLPEQGIAEARWFSGLSSDHARVEAVVAFAPLDVPADLPAHLDALAELPLVAGVRRLIQDEPPELATSPDFVRGVQALAAHDFTMDLCIRQLHFPAVIRLVEQCPDVQFVLDHLGKPTIAADAFASWAADMTRLAALPNVVVKLSGLLTEAAPGLRTGVALAPWLRHALDAFGPSRSMFGSDWPVLNLGGGFERWLDIVTQLVDDLSAEEAASVWSGTADAVYLARTRPEPA